VARDGAVRWRGILSRRSQPWCDLVGFVRGQGATSLAQRDAEVGFKVFGTMGIRAHDGTPRQPIFDRWVAARALPVAP
jgi:hypothetical protein